MIHIYFRMRNIFFALSRSGISCGSECQRGTGGWFDVVGGAEEVGSQALGSKSVRLEASRSLSQHQSPKSVLPTFRSWHRKLCGI